MKPVFENYDKIVKELKPLQVNWGGCGFYARELGSLLKAKNIKFKYVVLFNNITPKSNTNKLVKSNNVEEFNNLSWYHVMIKLDGKFIDAEGIHNTSLFNGKKMKTRTITDSFFNTFVSIDKFWNWNFDRDNIKKIKSVLKKNLVIK